MGEIRRMGDAAVPFTNIDGIDARASARGCARRTASMMQEKLYEADR
jgi:hypothetical protein